MVPNMAHANDHQIAEHLLQSFENPRNHEIAEAIGSVRLRVEIDVVLRRNCMCCISSLNSNEDQRQEERGRQQKSVSPQLVQTLQKDI